MDLKDKLLSSFMVFEDKGVNSPKIQNLRNDAIKIFETKGFPTRREEPWKYTSLKSVLKPDYTISPKHDHHIAYRDIKPFLVPNIDTHRIVFIDGKYASHLSQTTHDGMDVCLLSAALTKPKYRLVIETYFNKAANSESLSALNTAFATEGAFIHIPKNKLVEEPIEILHLATGSAPASFLQPRNLIVVEENAHVQITERHQTLGNATVMTNSVTEIFTKKQAIVDYYKIQNDHTKASLIDNTFIKQKQNSVASVHTFALGGKLTRNNLNFYQEGKGINSILKGITIIANKQHVDHNTLVHHIAPNCESHQDYKGIFDDAATGVFNGKIIVEKEAQKTNAFQANNNILLDDNARINTKPQLEIFADDVKCSHGCTIGQLDESALFYMRSRGIPKKEAKALLMYAFSNNVLSSVKIRELKHYITKIIAQKLHVDIGFDL